MHLQPAQVKCRAQVAYIFGHCKVAKIISHFSVMGACLLLLPLAAALHCKPISKKELFLPQNAHWVLVLHICLCMCYTGWVRHVCWNMDVNT